MFFLTACWLGLGTYLLIMIMTGQASAPFLLIAPFLMATIAMFALNKFFSRFVDAFGRSFYGGHQKSLSMDELVKCELAKVRWSKMNGRAEEALQITNELLKKIPDHPETLFLKAQIYHEAYGDDESARKYLLKIIDTVSDDKEVHRWAKAALKELDTLPVTTNFSKTGRS
ncbi:MAG: tetratricopeptide repeat protein [Smithellaceae bacterium]|nr:tetratricopeptide repeat protein [Smithellaceae bacterium]